MTNYWAIAVGINQYQSLQPLSFAQQDAQSLCEALVSEAGFLPDHCILMTDTSPEVVGRSTYPSRDNLQHWISFFKQELAHPGDWVWVFFSGYGVCSEGQDYLLPIEGNPANVAATGVTVRSLFQQLKALPTDRLLLLLDINRSQGTVAGQTLGTETAALAKEFGIPTLLSCRPEEFSHEEFSLNQGLFTTALVEGLRSHQCSTLSGLEEFLTARLPELCNHHDRPLQHPVLIMSNPEQVYQVITPVNWAETEPWKPAVPNPFVVEDNFFDTSIIDSDLFDTNSTDSGSFDADPIHSAPFANPEATPSRADAPLPVSSRPTASRFGEADPGFGADPNFELEQDDPLYLPSNSASPQPESVKPKAPDHPVPQEESNREAPSETGWEKVLLGGTALLLVLLLGVLWRQRDSFFGQQTASTTPSAPQVNGSPGVPANNSALNGTSTAQSPKSVPANAPKASAQPNPGGEKTAGSSSAPLTSQQLLDNARSVIKPIQASDASKAIEIARKIPATDPLYADAQQDIERWSRNILDIAKKRAQQKDYKQAIAAAQLIPKDRPQVYADAQKSIEQWKKLR
jgi:cytoskeletal protein RodZ